MSAELILRITCDYCDTQLSIPVREASTPDEVLQQVTQHMWTERADGHTPQHLCPLCVEVLEDQESAEEAW